MRDPRSDVIIAQTTLRTVPGCSPRRIANAIATSSRPGLSQPARSATVHAEGWTVVDLGSFHELLIAADDRLAELLEWPELAQETNFVATAVKTGRFSRRLQLDPGLMPPTSWNLTPCIDPLHCRADLAKSPGAGAIYLTLRGNAVTLCVAGGSWNLAGAKEHLATGKFKGRLQLVTGLHRQLAGASPPVAGPSSIYALMVGMRQEDRVSEFTA